MRRTCGLPVLWGVLALLSGCGQHAFQPRTSSSFETPYQASGGQAGYLRSTAVEAEGSEEADTAVENSVALQEKYSEAMERLLRAQEENKKLTATNRQQAGQIKKLKADLTQAQTELQEANDMLVEMRRELDKWRADVLGFREDMAKYQKAVLLSQRKILRLLGGEVPGESARAEDAP